LDRKQYGGHTFTIIAKGNSADNIYIQSATLNGKPLTRPWISRKELISGGTLRFAMGPKPNPDWGSAAADRPPATIPADFQYPPTPEPAPANPTVQFTLPIRVVCGSDDAAGDFQPDPEMTQGGVNQANSRIDTSAPNAAPAAVYQSERYAQDFTYTFPVPADQACRVRLHFAEIFDSGAGERVENISLNGKQVLTNLDIFATAGKNKALVEEFSDIKPDNGKISIRVTAAPNSPDQNAKISGIEILKQD
jgi:hypothetical protein